MAKSIVWSGSIIFILFVMLTGGMTAYAQVDDPPAERIRYFDETGHTVTGDFLKTYESATNPELIYGFPITEAYQDQSSERIIQYFERVRFELYNDNPPELRVYVTPLGKLLYEKTAELGTPRSIPGCRYFSEAKYYVCYTFLDFFNANGGVTQFGYPISNFEVHDGRIVQNFQRARFEWHPELPSGQKVQLTKLGKQYFELMGENPVRLIPVLPHSLGNDTVRPVVRNLKVRASFEHSITHTSGEQTIYIIVQDQKLMPVSDAKVKLEITLPTGKVLQPVELDPTDGNGITRYTFTFNDQSPGLVRAKIDASYDDVSQSTTASFLIWW